MKICDKNSALAEAAETIESYIIQERFSEGDKLPSERKMTQMWQLNRSTLRSALEALEQRHMVHAVPGRGYFIPHKRLVRNLQDLRPLYELAKEQGMSVTTSVIQAKFISADPAVCRHLSLAGGDPVFSLIRLRYVDDIPAMLEYSYINAKYVPGLDAVDFDMSSLYDALESRYSLIPREGEQKLAISCITQNEKALLQLPEGTPVLFTEGRTFFNLQSVPIESFRSIIRTDKILYMSQLHVVNEGKTK